MIKSGVDDTFMGAAVDGVAEGDAAAAVVDIKLTLDRKVEHNLFEQLGLTKDLRPLNIFYYYFWNEFKQNDRYTLMDLIYIK